MKIKVISVGKIKEKSWQIAETEYTRRIAKYAQITHVVVKDAPVESPGNQDRARQVEAKEIASKIKQGEFVIVLDRQGKQVSSESFAELFNSKMLHGQSSFVFVVGGPSGLFSDFISQADWVLSLSEMTLPHELAKVVLLEQIYRAFSIIKGKKYHK